MVEIDFNGLSIQSSEEFCQRLCNEQGILVLPAETFLWNNGFRIVLTCTEEALRECMNRIEEFVNSLKV